MKIFIVIISIFLSVSANGVQTQKTGCELDYDNLIFLDAENLAEQGIKEAYEALKPELMKYVTRPADIEERLDIDLPSYSVICEGKHYEIYAPELIDDGGQSWGRATVAFFSIVNNQLKNSGAKFYAFNGANDLAGMFLTREQYNAAVKSTEIKENWPYIPKLEHPWYGQNH